MCIVCQNVPAVMTGLSGAGLVLRAAIRRSRARDDGASASATGAAPPATPATTGTVGSAR